MRGHGWPLVLLAALLFAAPAAQAAPATSVAILNVGSVASGGEVYRPDDSTISVRQADPSSVSLFAARGTDHRGLELKAPPGQTLRPGTYADATQEAPVAGRPELVFDTDSCSYASRFEIRDLAVGPGGTVQRLWAIFQLHCYDVALTTFGEVRVNEPGPRGPLVAVPSLVRFPEQHVGGPSRPVPITLFATHLTHTLRSAVVSGRDAKAFRVVSDTCAGHPMATGESCQVWVASAPRRPGPASALVKVAGGPKVGLQGFGDGGRTQLVVHSDPGDPAGLGRSVSLGPADAYFWMEPQPRGVQLDVVPARTGPWRAGLALPPNGDLVPGHYVSGGSQGPSFFLGAVDGGCRDIDGTFDVTAVAYDSDHFLRSLGVDFVQHCQGAPGALRGTLDYDAGDAARPAPWMRDGPVVPFPREVRRRRHRRG